MDFALIGFGLGVGILVGMTGIGGGSLMTPMLILVFGVTPVTAIGTDLAYAAVTKTVGGYKHWTQKTVDLRLSSWMALGSVPAAVGGVYVLGLIEDAAGRDFDDLLLTILACALLLTGAATLVRAFLKSMHERERDTIELETRHKVARRGARHVRGLRARHHLGRQRRADRRRADPAVPAHAHARGRHRRLPRGDPALGSRPCPHRGRQRGLRPRRSTSLSARSPACGSAATGRCGWSPPCCARRSRSC